MLPIDLQMKNLSVCFLPMVQEHWALGAQNSRTSERMKCWRWRVWPWTRWSCAPQQWNNFTRWTSLQLSNGAKLLLIKLIDLFDFAVNVLQRRVQDQAVTIFKFCCRRWSTTHFQRLATFRQTSMVSFYTWLNICQEDVNPRHSSTTGI